MMTQKRFLFLAESYGADLSRWPPADRGPAEALLAQSPQAHAVLREQQDVDAAIARAFDAQDAELQARSAHEDPQAALARLRAGVAGRIAGQGAKTRLPRGWRHIMSRRSAAYPAWAAMAGGLLVFRRAGLVLGCACAVTAGLWLGWMQSSGGAGDPLNMFLVIPVSGGG
ncbi:hypothetical protein ACLRDC_03130 [Gluconacetobacter sacchari]|uniref:Uncharacterized protein n=2 Tax=Gluconacetobacter sacchari TaxID=92759 RepID=A0A7W4IBU3_9PROT|nr:hypothetical protein [Gluconacetobacter sacchari]MBB2159999.1 hypothetical protein [Gluconacetobacter sacchari]GBQ27266.1 hypothetical protein AA12717_2621 [Gluconacetobacter sacchari DSM 12717]